MTPELLTLLESFLLDTRQITSLAARQARILSRSVCDTERTIEARAVFLLVLTALARGAPRAHKEFLLEPVAGDLSWRITQFEQEHGVDPMWSQAFTAPDAQATITRILDDTLDNPGRFAPLSGPRPLSAADAWPFLVVDRESGLIGFSRYFKAVVDLERGLGARLRVPLDTMDAADAARLLERVFITDSILSRTNRFHARQIAAAALALRTGFLIVSGGPGTGKTSVVTQILRCLVRAFSDIRPDRIVLCAPTGRAKARLGESIDTAIGSLEKKESVDRQFDLALKNLQRTTVHGLLGIRPDGTTRYDRRNPLPYQVIVVDEASMVDLCLFSTLIEATPPGCRIILVGDMHQLPSIEAGAVLGDLTARFGGAGNRSTLTGQTAQWVREAINGFVVDETESDSLRAPAVGAPERDAGALADHAVILTRNYRSPGHGQAGEIPALAGHVNAQDADRALELLLKRPAGNVALDTRDGTAPVTEWLEERMSGAFLSVLRKLKDFDPDTAGGRDLLVEAFAMLNASRILTLAHEGPRGRLAINALAGRLLRKKSGLTGSSAFFCGQPVIMTVNHHDLDLYNGDCGVVAMEQSGALIAVFCRAHGFVRFAIDRLIGLEPAFAMTVHKSQGSEFDEVLLVLPDYKSPLLSRQIIYTGLTRARNRAVILGAEKLLRYAILTSHERPGGIAIA